MTSGYRIRGLMLVMWLGRLFVVPIWAAEENNPAPVEEEKKEVAATPAVSTGQPVVNQALAAATAVVTTNQPMAFEKKQKGPIYKLPVELQQNVVEDIFGPIDEGKITQITKKLKDNEKNLTPDELDLIEKAFEVKPAIEVFNAHNKCKFVKYEEGPDETLAYSLFVVNKDKDGKKILIKVSKDAKGKFFRMVKDESGENEKVVFDENAMEHVYVKYYDYTDIPAVQSLQKLIEQVSSSQYYLNRLFLHVCSKAKPSVEAIKSLIGAGANPNQALILKVSIDEYTDNDNPEAVEHLIEHGANPNSEDSNKATPLHYAAFKYRFKEGRALIRLGANVNAANNHGDTPLHLAVKKDFNGMVQALINATANVNAANNYGTTPLHHAAAQGSLNMLGVLIGAGANVNAADNYGNTPLHLAAARSPVESNFFETVKSFIDNHAADVNAANKGGETPLHLAVKRYLGVKNYKPSLAAELEANRLVLEKGYLDAVKALIKAGADPNVGMIGNDTLLSYVVKNDSFEVAKVLLVAGAKVDSALSHIEDPKMKDLLEAAAQQQKLLAETRQKRVPQDDLITPKKVRMAWAEESDKGNPTAKVIHKAEELGQDEKERKEQKMIAAQMRAGKAPAVEAVAIGKLKREEWDRNSVVSEMIGGIMTNVPDTLQKEKEADHKRQQEQERVADDERQQCVMLQQQRQRKEAQAQQHLFRKRLGYGAAAVGVVGLATGIAAAAGAFNKDDSDQQPVQPSSDPNFHEGKN